MRTRAQQWGDSLALRIPRTLAVEARIEQGSLVEITLVGGKLVVTSIVHGEVDMGTPMGQELW
jgi:antitoxin MazE